MAHTIQGRSILITGGAGFIGSRIATALVDHNEVTAFDNLVRNGLSATRLRAHPNFRLHVGDVLDRAAVHAAVSAADLIVHCAGIAGIDTVVKQPVRTMLVNMVGSANVLAAAAEAHSERVVCFSTSEVFGSIALGARETDTSSIGAAGEARWTYAVSKLAEEHLGLAYHRQDSVPVTVLRPFNIYGPGQVGDGAIRTFVIRALKGEPLEIHGDGSQIRAWCYIDDMVDAALLSLTEPAAVGEAFNIGNRRSVQTILGLANTVIRVLGSQSQIEHRPRLSADVELRIPSVDKARDVLGFHAAVDLEEGLRRTATYYEQTLR